MAKTSYQYTLKLIVDILSGLNSTEELKMKLSQFTDWDNFVKIASNHLVLTTVFCRLEQMNLLNNLPDDLNAYLAEITQINRNRNVQLIHEARTISTLLTENNVQFLFFKGMGMLLSKSYKDIGERMIGDIDILVEKSQLKKAFNLLKEYGYDQLYDFNYNVKDFRHKPRQAHKNSLAAVELHDNILKKGKRDLINLDNLLDNPISTDGFLTPSIEHTHLINVYSTQINNNNYYYNRIILKNLYETIITIGTRGSDNKFPETEYIYHEHYMWLYNFWVYAQTQRKGTSIQKLKQFLYTIKIKDEFVNTFVYRLNFIILNVKIRIIQFIKNKSYRNHVIKNKLLVKTKMKIIS